MLLSIRLYLQMADLSALETRTKFEEQKRTVRDLQDRLAEAEHQLIEGENLRKKLHNTILVKFFLLIIYCTCCQNANISFCYRN